MADDCSRFEISSPSKRMKISRDCYSPAFRHTVNQSGHYGRLQVSCTDDDDLNMHEKARPPNTSPDPTRVQRSCNGGHIIPRVSSLGVTSSSDGTLVEEYNLVIGNGSSNGSSDCASHSPLDLDEPDSSTNISMENNEISKMTHESSYDADDSDEVASTISGLSALSDISGEDWNPVARPMNLVQRQIALGSNPRSLLQSMLPPSTTIPDELDDITLWKIIIGIVNEPPRRRKLPHVKSLSDVLNLLQTCSKIIVLTGAGVSVSCGIPDFRSKNGIYARLAKDFPDLPDPQAMFDFQYFKRDPRPFYKFAKEIYPGQFQPSPCHRFIKLLEEQGKLLRNYTQNIDTLERVAGIQRVIECHGSFATASCVLCKHRVDSSFIKEDIFNQTIPRCCNCNSHDPLAIMKPDIVFFGEGLSDEFHARIAADKDECDLLIVIGSSLKVRPVALIPSSIPSHVPQVLINREHLMHVNFDVELLGDCDVIINEICQRLGSGWNSICYKDTCISEIKYLPLKSTSTLDVDSRSEEVSEHSSDPCDSTSYPHKTNKLCKAKECENNYLPGPSLSFHNSVLPTNEDPDSTNRSENASPNFQNDLQYAMKIEDSPTNLGLQSNTESQIASRLPENTYLFYSHRLYVFPGAEVCDSDLDSDSDASRDSCSSSDITDNDTDEIIRSPVRTVDEDSMPASPDQGIDANDSNEEMLTGDGGVQDVQAAC